MAYLRFWTIITLVMAACVSFFKDMLLHEGWGEFVNPFARAMPVAFNNVGVIFGVASVMLWTGKISPFSNKTAFFLLIIGAFSYVLQALIDPLQASAGQLMAVFFWPMGAASLIYCA